MANLYVVTTGGSDSSDEMQKDCDVVHVGDIKRFMCEAIECVLIAVKTPVSVAGIALKRLSDYTSHTLCHENVFFSVCVAYNASVADLTEVQSLRTSSHNTELTF